MGAQHVASISSPGGGGGESVHTFVSRCGCLRAYYAGLCGVVIRAHGHKRGLLHPPLVVLLLLYVVSVIILRVRVTYIYIFIYIEFWIFGGGLF